MRRALATIVLIAVALGVYLSNGDFTGSFDSTPNSLLTYSVLERGRLDLDEFRGSYFTQLGGQYAFTEAPNGHLAPLFPIGTALLAAPAYGVLYGVHRVRGETPAITAAGFEPQREREEKLVAAFIAALAVGLFFLCALELAPFVPALCGALAFAFATSMWTIAAQALWQHGPVNLVLLAGIYALLRANRAEDARVRARWIVVAGLVAGFLPVIRPTALIFSTALLAYVVMTHRRASATFLLAFALACAPGIAWNAYFFHAPAGGYTSVAGRYVFDPRANLTAIAALLLSPSRGLFVFTPLVLMAFAGIAAAVRVRDATARLLLWLAGAGLALALSYAFFSSWWGGFTYGPRYLSDLTGIACLLALYGVRAYAVRRSALTYGVAGALAAWSLVVQIVGAYSGAAGADWNAVPVSIDERPQRLWQPHDNQIERNARAFFYKTFAWDAAASPAYVHAYRVEVTALEPAGGGLVAHLRNTGAVPAYGYESGIYRGQTRVAVDAPGGGEQFLFLAGTLQPGETGIASGEITAAAKPGTYALAAHAILVGEPASTRTLTTKVTIQP